MFSDLSVIPKLPAINLEETQAYFENALGFTLSSRYPEYLIMESGNTELHFFEFKELDPLTNYSMLYIRVPSDIDLLYEQMKSSRAIMHPNGKLEAKPWGVKEFAILDPNHTLFTFGQLI